LRTANARQAQQKTLGHGPTDSNADAPVGPVWRLLFLYPQTTSDLPWHNRYGFAVILTLASLIVTICLWPFTQVSPYVFPAMAAGVATWCYGPGPGAASVVVTLLMTAPWMGSIRLPLPLSAVGLIVQASMFAMFTAFLGRRFDALVAARRKEQWEAGQREQTNLEVAKVLADEHTARAEAERARQRFAFLSEASNLLSVTLDRETVLQRIIRLTVPKLADWCEVDLLKDEAVNSMRPGWQSTADEEVDLLCGARTDPRLRETVCQVIRYGAPLHVEGVPLDDGEFERPLASFVTVPLSARGRTMGAVTLALSTNDRCYDQEDIALIGEVARRAALAIDNARLYRESQEAKAEIQDLNQRLQRAMTETHHRVKNNLQVIAAMVDMHVLEDADSIPMEEMRRMGTHIRTLATVHDILTHQAKSDGEAADVSTKELLGKLLAGISQASEQYRIEYHIDDAKLPARQATSLALVVNELVANALKHGKRDVLVRFVAGEREARLTVEDDGPGFPKDFDPMRAANTGLELVDNLSRWDLAGGTTYANRPSGGGHVEVSFPLAA
jgi:two-component sensor histidine kinase